MLYIVATSVQHIFSLCFTEFEFEVIRCVVEALGKAIMENRTSKTKTSACRLYIQQPHRRTIL